MKMVPVEIRWFHFSDLYLNPSLRVVVEDPWTSRVTVSTGSDSLSLVNRETRILSSVWSRNPG